MTLTYILNTIFLATLNTLLNYIRYRKKIAKFI